ncbi:hypothetical protein CPJCM30710_00160 [Clostridium polyendosporum]|uniref:Uncharacterized protein n=1 Tax=Clostridium polyendosporum TaxID=69208 RepID=A0A919RVP6_9CLOT|nr:DUF6448 family protein [Clostridium polyendosporum]GIM27350.1 hypothetical protein CPJCM30710_00160 [Clostridium polyendosporum]
MLRKSILRGKFTKKIAAVLMLAAVVTVSKANVAYAHCDTADGPVVTAAKNAIEKKDAKLVLPYVAPQYEEELKKAFDKTIAAHGENKEAQELVDNYFYETTVRLHRAGEGAVYTGIKSAGQDFGPALPAAEKAIESGSTEELKKIMIDTISKQIDEKYKNVTEKKSEGTATVEAARENVEAQFGFEKYVLGIYDAAMAKDGHNEGGESSTGHNHGEVAADSHGGETNSEVARHNTEAVKEGNEKNNYIALASTGLGALVLGFIFGRKGKKCNH